MCVIFANINSHNKVLIKMKYDLIVKFECTFLIPLANISFIKKQNLKDKIGKIKLWHCFIHDGNWNWSWFYIIYSLSQ